MPASLNRQHRRSSAPRGNRATHKTGDGAQNSNSRIPIAGGAVYKKYDAVQHALAARIARVIALTALAALGLSRAPFHEPFHADGRQWSMTVTERSDRNPPQRHLNLTTW
jgi:hypothetical protein